MEEDEEEAVTSGEAMEEDRGEAMEEEDTADAAAAEAPAAAAAGDADDEDDCIKVIIPEAGRQRNERIAVLAEKIAARKAAEAEAA